MATVNEPGLYTLDLGGRKPEAKRFKRWVTHEVLPAIRRWGNSLAVRLPADCLRQAGLQEGDQIEAPHPSGDRGLPRQ